MQRRHRVRVRNYRGHQLEVRDEGGARWSVTIFAPPGGGKPEVLHTEDANALAALLNEAQHRIDARLLAYQRPR